MIDRHDVTINIGGKAYTLSGIESETYLKEVAAYLNEKLRGFSDDSSYWKLSADMRSVMLQLNIADDYFKERDRVSQLEIDLAELKAQSDEDIAGRSAAHEQELDQLKAGFMEEVRQMRDRLTGAEKEAESLRAANRGLETELEGIRQQETQTMQELEQVRQEREQAVQRKDGALRELEQAVREKKEALDDLARALQEKNQALQEKERAEQEKLQALKDKEKAVREKEDTLHGREQAAPAGNDTSRMDESEYEEQILTMYDKLEKWQRELEGARETLTRISDDMRRV